MKFLSRDKIKNMFSKEKWKSIFTRATFKRLFQNMLLFLGSTFFILLICEILVRIFFDQTAYTVSSYPEKMFDSKSKTKLRANFNGEFAPGEYSASIHINSIGLRDKEPNSDSSKYKIMGLGDSFTFGHGVEADESFLELLEDRFNKNKPTDILNAGIPGTGPDHYLKVYKHINASYKADHVFFCIFIGNDLNDLKLKQKGSLPKKTKKKEDNSGSSFKTFLRKNIHLYSFIVDRAKTIPFIREFLVNSGIAHGMIGNYIIDVLKPDLSSEYKKRWDYLFEILNEIKTLNENLTVVIIPTREQVYPDRLTKAINQLGFKAKDIDIHFPNNKINQYCESINITCIDLLPDFIESSRTKNLYFDIDPHFNKNGHNLAAKIIHNNLKNNIKK